MSTNALDKIVKKIELSAEVEVERLRVENEQKCCKLVEKRNKLIEDEKSKLIEKIELFKHELKVKVDSENFIYKNSKILEIKQRLISEVKKKVIDFLCCDKFYSARYFDFMEHLISDNLPVVDLKCVLFYGSLDYLRFLKNLKFKSEGFLEIKKSTQFSYGALVCCDDFEINLNTYQLVSDWFAKNSSEILSVLLQGE